MLTSSGTAPPPFRWQVPLNVEAHQAHHQLLQQKSLNLNVDVQQVAQISDEVGRGGQEVEGVGGGLGQSESQLGQWRTIPITRLDLSLDLTGRDLQNMDVS